MHQSSTRHRQVLVADSAAPRAARLAVAAVLAELGLDGRIGPLAALLASELVTNAVRYGEGDTLRLDVRACSQGVRVAAADRSPSLPVVCVAEPPAEGGRGVALIDALSTRWGVDQSARHKTVWFEITLS